MNISTLNLTPKISPYLTVELSKGKPTVQEK